MKPLNRFGEGERPQWVPSVDPPETYVCGMQEDGTFPDETHISLGNGNYLTRPSPTLDELE